MGAIGMKEIGSFRSRMKAVCDPLEGLSLKSEEEKKRLLKQMTQVYAKAILLMWSGDHEGVEAVLFDKKGPSRIAGALIKYAEEDPRARSFIRTTIRTLSTRRDTSRRAVQLARALVRGPFRRKVEERGTALPEELDLRLLIKTIEASKSFGGDDRVVLGASCDVLKRTENGCAASLQAQRDVRNLISYFEQGGKGAVQKAERADRTLSWFSHRGRGFSINAF